MKNLKRLSTITFLLFIFGALLISGCSESAKTLDKSIKGAQMIVNPGTVRLGVARIMGTKIIFSGSGFEPGDSVFIQLLNVPVNGKKVALAIAAGDVQKDGTFNAKVGKLAKISDFLRAKLGTNKKGKTVPIITRPPMPADIYTAQATSMLSAIKAECSLKVKGPSLFDKIKDWLGVKMGKIIKRVPKGG